MSYRVRLIIAVIISAILLILWQVLLNKQQPEQQEITTESIEDTSSTITTPEPVITTSQQPVLPDTTSYTPDSFAISLTTEDSSPYTLSNKDVEITIDPLHGASIEEIKLLGYQLTRDSDRLSLFPLVDLHNADSVYQIHPPGRQRGMLFSVVSQENEQTVISTQKIPMTIDTTYFNDDTAVVIFSQQVGIHRSYVKYQLPPQGFMFKVSFWSEGINRRFYQGYLSWEGGLAITEPDLPLDQGKRRFFVAMNPVGYNHWKKSYKDIISGEQYTDQALWAGMANQYFMIALIPRGERDSDIASSVNFSVPEGGHPYTVTINYGPIQQDTFNFWCYAGPLDERDLAPVGFHLEENIEMGWTWLRPISKVILWILRALHSFIPNYGLVIIIFALLMMLVFSPLTLYSQKSMKRMQELQPKLEELKKKYKDDPKKLNEETIKMYREESFNPFTGCLPLLLQMPVFMALYQIMRTTIVLRGEGFLWLQDLSRPETTIPISLPFSSSPGIGIFPLLMGVLMFLQQKLTNPNPQQKAMTWIMPIFLTYLFISFPSAIVLYWTSYNLFGLIQQLIIKYKDDLKKIFVK